MNTPAANPQMAPPRRTVLFIGVGKMGLPMARHLHAAGHRVIAVDGAADRRALAAAQGLEVVDLLPVALHRLGESAGSPLIVSSLPDDDALATVGEVLAAHAPLAAVWIDTSTVSPAASRAAAERVAATRGVACLRAPVSGNATMAERAALTVFVSGERTLYDACGAIFACWGPQRFWLGPGDEARIAKLVVNLLIVGTSTMLAEALALGERGGLESKALWQAIEASAAASPIIKAKAPALKAGDYTPTFTVEQMRKDVSLIRAAAEAVGVATPVADVASAALDRAAAAGAGALDYAVVIREARRAA
jgi:3-hydroxyisobutyrate dehydrogenase-like beta-hydroxyacid dehydrogenase